MTDQPPIPAAAKSPYPLHPAPIHGAPAHDTPAPDTPVHDAPSPRLDIEAAGDKLAAAAAQLPRPSRNQWVGIGAAFGIGSAALVAALLYSRRGDGGGKTDRGADRARVAAEQPYEVTYFARKHGITARQAREIIKQAGPSRKAANALAEERKTAGAA